MTLAQNRSWAYSNFTYYLHTYMNIHADFYVNTCTHIYMCVKGIALRTTVKGNLNGSKCMYDQQETRYPKTWDNT